MGSKYLSKTIHKVNLEITNRCALACPGCARTHSLELFKKNPNAGKYQFSDLTLKDIQELAPFLKTLQHIVLSGVFGDPIYNPEFKEILRYLVGLDIPHTIETNGSSKGQDFWDEVATIVHQDRTYWTFSIDGLEDTNHLYRQGAKWSSILPAVKALTPKCHVTWKYVVFSHNIDQIEEAKQLAQELGVHDFSLRAAGHLPEGHEFYPAPEAVTGFKRTNKFQVKQTLNAWRKNTLNEDVNKFIKIYPACLKPEIDVLITAHKRFYPCCGSSHDSEAFNENGESWFARHKNEFKIDTKIDDVLALPLWEQLQTSWQSVQTAPLECIKRCGVHSEHWSKFDQGELKARELEQSTLEVWNCGTTDTTDVPLTH